MPCNLITRVYDRLAPQQKGFMSGCRRRHCQRLTAPGFLHGTTRCVEHLKWRPLDELVEPTPGGLEIGVDQFHDVDPD